MDANTIIQLVQTCGFPIVMCGVMSWYVKYQGDIHKKEIDAIRESVDNNTKILTRLCERMGSKDDE